MYWLVNKKFTDFGHILPLPARSLPSPVLKIPSGRQLNSLGAGFHPSMRALTSLR